jgi:hypothetical protein
MPTQELVVDTDFDAQLWRPNTVEGGAFAPLAGLARLTKLSLKSSVGAWWWAVIKTMGGFVSFF